MLSPAVAHTLVNWDRIIDKIPVLSTVTNAIVLLAKTILACCGENSTNFYAFHLKNKSFMKSVVLLIPVLGQVIVYFYNNYSAKKAEELYIKSKIRIFPDLSLGEVSYADGKHGNARNEIEDAANRGHEQALIVLFRYHADQCAFSNALKWLGKLVLNNEAPATVFSAIITEKTSPQEAVELYKEAANLGDQVARLRLKQCYAKGELGVKADPAEAEKWNKLLREKFQAETDLNDMRECFKHFLNHSYTVLRPVD